MNKQQALTITFKYFAICIRIISCNLYLQWCFHLKCEQSFANVEMDNKISNKNVKLITHKHDPCIIVSIYYVLHHHQSIHSLTTLHIFLAQLWFLARSENCQLITQKYFSLFQFVDKLPDNLQKFLDAITNSLIFCFIILIRMREP